MNTNDPLDPGAMPDPSAAEEGGAVPAPLPVASLDVAPELPPDDMAEPAAETAAPRPPAKAGPRPLPDTLTAARDAAAFVAQLFAEVSVPDNAAPAMPAPETPVNDAAADEQSEAGPDTSGEVAADPLHGQHVLVLGLGASGLAITRWCVRQGARVTVVDTREAPPQLANLQADLPQVTFSAAAFEAGLVEGSDIRAVFKSPGLSPEAVEPVISAARAQGLVCGNELSLFAQALSSLAKNTGYKPHVLAISGTNGKTTTTALTGQLLVHAGKTVAVAGNIGPSLLDTLATRLDAGTLPEAWVLELSSFQLDGVQGFEPSAATVLNLTQDHLDWHGSMQAYGEAKSRIFGSKAVLVLNRDDPAVMAMLPEPVRVKLQKPQWREYVTFGLGMPQRPGDYGIETVNGMAWLVRAAEADETVKRRKDEEVVLHIQRLMPVEAMRLRGRHNATNALAALALAGAAGGALASMLHGLRDYAGEPHRVTPVAVVNNVEYFDDSKGTNVGATVAALTGLGAERKLVLIAGGDGKGQDFSPLADPVRSHARAVILLGRDAPQIRSALEGTGVRLMDADSMEAAVELAAAQAQTGDAVLMSPACASFDMFDNYGHRARVFCEAVQALARDAGVVS
jgi:UDP-N-acetylmuramoylalanine--D-glutamate ligase